MAEKGSHTVLVVDDDPGHRGMLEALLGRWGLAVTSAGDGKEAVARVCERPFDVVLMDIRMPDMDGITALKEIRKYNPAVPVGAHDGVFRRGVRCGGHEVRGRGLSHQAPRL